MTGSLSGGRRPVRATDSGPVAYVYVVINEDGEIVGVYTSRKWAQTVVATPPLEGRRLEEHEVRDEPSAA